jgi:hypothetical protein
LSCSASLLGWPSGKKQPTFTISNDFKASYATKKEQKSIFLVKKSTLEEAIQTIGSQLKPLEAAFFCECLL